MSLIVFICGSNRSRSPMAAAYFADIIKRRNIKGVEVASAGLRAPHGETVCWEAREALNRKGLEPLQIGTVLLLPKLVKASSLIVSMTEDQREQAEEKFISAKGKVRSLMSIVGSSRPIVEPPKGNLKKYQECLEQMIPALEALADIVE